MASVLMWVLGALALVSSACSAYFSIRSRRSADIRLRGLYGARMNVCMGLMLIFISLIQMFMFTGSTLRVIVGAVFLLLGLFNLYAGLRNQSHFKRLLEKS